MNLDEQFDFLRSLDIFIDYVIVIRVRAQFHTRILTFRQEIDRKKPQNIICFLVSVGRRRKEERVAVLSRTNWTADPRRLHQRSERIRKTWSLPSLNIQLFLVNFVKSCQIFMNKWSVDVILFKKITWQFFSNLFYGRFFGF